MDTEYQGYLGGDVVLNLMRGGPRHHELYETEVLATSYKMGWITGYVWSPEKIVGSESGREARVWVWDENSA